MAEFKVPELGRTSPAATSRASWSRSATPSRSINPSSSSKPTRPPSKSLHRLPDESPTSRSNRATRWTSAPWSWSWRTGPLGMRNPKAQSRKSQGDQADIPAPEDPEAGSPGSRRPSGRRSEGQGCLDAGAAGGRVEDAPKQPTSKAQAPKPAAGYTAAPAAPGVRRLAREVGVNIDEVQGTGPDGRISEEDVKEHARRILSSLPSLGGAAAASSGAVAVRPAAPLPDFSRWGEIERQPMSNIRRTTSDRLSHAWTTIPHVTQFDKADITAMEELRKKYREQVTAAGGNLTVTAMLVKVIATAVKQFPQFNASLDPQSNEIIFKKYVNVGVAVDTDRGLLVPVVRNADGKNITEIAVDVHQLAEKARNRKLTLEEMSGGGITISNLGGIGGTYFTPIVNWPEVAILGVSRGIVESVWRSDKFEPRQLLPLSLSYDHRVIDGADAMRFLRWVVEAIEQPSSCPFSADGERIHAGCGPRRGTGRLCGRLLCRRSRHAGGADRRGGQSRRRLPLSRLHSVESAAARREGDRRSPSCQRVGRHVWRAEGRRRQAAIVQAGRRRQAHRRRWPGGQTAQGEVPPGTRHPDRAPLDDDRGHRGRDRRCSSSTASWRPARSQRGFPRSRSTVRE